MKIIAGADFFTILKRSRPLAAPTPTNISTNSEPERWKKGTLASPATARAKRVLPVPGAPIKRTPRGMRAPMSKNFLGLRKKSTISTSSSLASLAPATSLKSTRSFRLSGWIMRARDWPKVKACIPPCFNCRAENQMKNAMRSTGPAIGRITPSQILRALVPSTSSFTAFNFSGSTP